LSNAEQKKNKNKNKFCYIFSGFTKIRTLYSKEHKSDHFKPPKEDQSKGLKKVE
jgi:hypothetical protein